MNFAFPIFVPNADCSTAAPSEPAKVNKDVIYGVSIAVLAVMLISFIIYFIKKHLRRKLKGPKRPYVAII